MRIIGGRDYYDGAGYGVDKSTLFIRKAYTFPNSPLRICGREDSGRTIYRFEVLVAGKLYAGLRVVPAYNYYGYRDESFFIYDEFQYADFIKSVHPYNHQYLDLTISDNHRKQLESWAIDNKVVTAIAGAQTSEVTSYNSRGLALFTDKRTTALVNSDALKDIEFYRVLSPAAAHEAISAWVGGVLPYNAPTLQLSDRSKIQKAGFDYITSFRKAKA